jgi:hypothetical protein
MHAPYMGPSNKKYDNQDAQLIVFHVPPINMKLEL